ncbi:MAG TPA: hypothetical protein VGI68_08625 [Mycobacterium sp.]
MRQVFEHSDRRECDAGRRSLAYLISGSIPARVQFCSGLVDLVVCVCHHGGGGHRRTLAGEQFVGRLTEQIAKVGANSGIWRILKRLGLNRLPASQRYKRLDKRWQRYEKQLPRHQVQIDVKFVEPLKAAARRPAHQVLPVHRDRRLHPTACAAYLPAL